MISKVRKTIHVPLFTQYTLILLQLFHNVLNPEMRG